MDRVHEETPMSGEWSEQGEGNENGGTQGEVLGCISMYKNAAK